MRNVNSQPGRESSHEHNKLSPTVSWSGRQRRRARGTRLVGRRALGAEPKKRPKVAAIFTVMHHRSHAHVILENFLEPYLFNGKRTEPGVEVVSFYADQRPAGDMAQRCPGNTGFRYSRQSKKRSRLGGKRLAVDAVLSIGEHGQYPTNKLGQTEYPRKRFFDAIVAVMRRSRRFVPLYNDKHLSYRWDWAKEMVEAARELGIPFMAGSSVPLAQRIPPFELPAGAAVTEAVCIHGGGIESYDFHALEVLQSIVEFRKGGETGIASVEFLRGDALWQAARQGRWSLPLAETAMAMELGKKPITLRRVDGEKEAETHGILLTYKDGLRGCVLKVGASEHPLELRLHAQERSETIRDSVLCRSLAEPQSIQSPISRDSAALQNEDGSLSGGTNAAGQRGAQCRRALAPQAVEVVKTPHLEFAYAARDFTALREMGATWKIITEATPEPKGIDRSGREIR